MTAKHVLGHLARRFAVSEENIATEALTWLLKSKAAKTALVDLVGGDLPDDLSFIGQVGHPENGRPDIVGIDAQGRERLVIEAKFAAGLTAQQPNGYLNRLDHSVGGVLLVVAPNSRHASLWSELLGAIPDVDTSSAGEFRVDVGGGRTLVLVDWRSLVGRVRDRLSASGERELMRDAEQLLDLTEVMDNETFVVHRTDDLSQRTGRQVHQLLRDVVDPTYYDIVGDSASPATRYGRTPSQGKYYYGRYLRSRKTGKVLWFGFLPRAWSEHGLSPLWIQVKVTESWSRQRLREALREYDLDGQAGLFDETPRPSFLIPLIIPLDTGVTGVVKDLRGRIEQVLVRLDAVVPASESPVPEVVEETEEVD